MPTTTVVYLRSARAPRAPEASHAASRIGRDRESSQLPLLRLGRMRSSGGGLLGGLCLDRLEGKELQAVQRRKAWEGRGMGGFSCRVAAFTALPGGGRALLE